MELESITTGVGIAIFLAISIGAFLKGITGLGLPMFAIPALATITTVEDAVIIMIIPGIGANLWLVVNHRRYWHLLREHRPFLIGGLVGGILGTVFLAAVDDRWLRLTLVLWLALYLIQYFLGNSAETLFRSRGRKSAAIGLFAGTAQGAMGISAHVVAPYFHDRNIAAPAYAFLVAFAFLVFAVAQSGAVLASPMFTETRLILGMTALVPTLIFIRIGIMLSTRVSREVFTNLLLFMFVLMELKLLFDVVSTFEFN